MATQDAVLTLASADTDSPLREHATTRLNAADIDGIADAVGVDVVDGVVGVGVDGCGACADDD